MFYISWHRVKMSQPAPLYRDRAGIVITRVSVCVCVTVSVCPSVRKITHESVDEMSTKLGMA